MPIISEPFNLVTNSVRLYITHESFYTRLIHTIATFAELIAILLLLNMINILSIEIFSLTVHITVGIMVAGLLAIYFICLEWLAGLITSIIITLPLFLVNLCIAWGFNFGTAFVITAIALYFICGLIELSSHYWFDGERTAIKKQKPLKKKLLFIMYITFHSPFFFLLFLLIGIGYKRNTLGIAIKEKYGYRIKRDNFKYKTTKYDKNNKPVDFCNKTHPMDLT